jgi:hypothetical protein
MRFITYRAFANITATADAYSNPFDISSVFSIGIQAHVVTGTARGKAYIQVSAEGLDEAPTTWVSLVNHADLTASADTDYALNEVAANWARVFWDHTSGTGTLDVHVKTNGY